MLELIRDCGGKLESSNLIPLSDAGTGAPLVLLGLSPLFRSFLLRLAPELPLFALGNVATDRLPAPFRLADIAAMQVAALRAWRPKGPLVLGGWCLDGVLAYEMAQQFRVSGQPLPLVVLIDSPNPRAGGPPAWLARGNRLIFHLGNLARMDTGRVLAYGRERWQTLTQDYRSRKWQDEYRRRLRQGRDFDPDLRDGEQIMRIAALEYAPLPYPGAVLLLRPLERPKGKRADLAFGWWELAPNLQIADIPGDHVTMFREPNAARMAQTVRTAIERIR
jgi:thioesterase domain-containing protein